MFGVKFEAPDCIRWQGSRARLVRTYLELGVANIMTRSCPSLRVSRSRQEDKTYPSLRVSRSRQEDKALQQAMNGSLGIHTAWATAWALPKAKPIGSVQFKCMSCRHGEAQ